MTVAATTTANSTGLGATTAFATSAFENKELFMSMLVAQLKNQDPTSPMDQKDMMSQMAQLGSVEQMTNMAKTLEQLQTGSGFSQSVSLIGKTVDFINAEGGVTYGSQVTAVSATQGNAKLMLEDGTLITVDDVVKVQ